MRMKTRESCSLNLHAASARVHALVQNRTIAHVYNRARVQSHVCKIVRVENRACRTVNP
jgi:hypothetical protein